MSDFQKVAKILTDSGVLPEPKPFAVPLDEFMDGPTEVPWLWDGIIAEPSLVILAAKPKFGKTLLSFNLAISASRGQNYLGRGVKKCNVLIVQLEDPPVVIRNRLEKMGANGERIFIRAGSPLAGQDWQELRRFIQENKIDLTIIDPFIFAIRANEQDATATGAFLREVRELIFATDCSVLLVHHHRKSGGEHGDAIRGSSAILGAVDVALEIVREDEDDPTASLKITSRFANVEPEILSLDVPTLTWSSRGSAKDYKQSRRQGQIIRMLENRTEVDIDTISVELDLNPSNFRRDLKNLVAKGQVVEERQTTGGRPKYLYRLPEDCIAEKPQESEGAAEKIRGHELAKESQPALLGVNPDPRVGETAEKPDSDEFLTDIKQTFGAIES